jgi:hypothetical protein
LLTRKAILELEMQQRPVERIHYPVPVGPSTIKLVDHLGAILEACATFAQCNPCDLSEEAVGTTRRAELAAITHLLQARDCARDAAREDWRLADSIGHFIAGTEALEHAGAMEPRELTLGRRLAVTTAVELTHYLLQTCDAAYRPPLPAAPPVYAPYGAHATAA